jgi:hypothetical protein
VTLRTAPQDLSRAARAAHFVELEITAGGYRAAQSRLWLWQNGRLRTS